MGDGGVTCRDITLFGIQQARLGDVGGLVIVGMTVCRHFHLHPSSKKGSGESVGLQCFFWKEDKSYQEQ